MAQHNLQSMVVFFCSDLLLPVCFIFKFSMYIFFYIETPKEIVCSISGGESTTLWSCCEQAVLIYRSPGCLGRPSAATGQVLVGMTPKQRENGSSFLSPSCSVLFGMSTLQLLWRSKTWPVHTVPELPIPQSHCSPLQPVKKAVMKPHETITNKKRNHSAYHWHLIFFASCRRWYAAALLLWKSKTWLFRVKMKF